MRRARGMRAPEPSMQRPNRANAKHEDGEVVFSSAARMGSACLAWRWCPWRRAGRCSHSAAPLQTFRPECHRDRAPLFIAPPHARKGDARLAAALRILAWSATGVPRALRTRSHALCPPHSPARIRLPRTRLSPSSLWPSPSRLAYSEQAEQLIVFAFHDSHTLKEAVEEGKQRGMLVTVLWLD